MADASAQKRQRFEEVFPKLRDELLAYLRREGLPEDVVTWFQRNLNHTVPGGKLNRGISVVDSVEIIKGRELNDDEYFKAALLGWCVELLQATFLVYNDLTDQRVAARRGRPCYFRLEGVNLLAINDACMLEGAIFQLLKTHLRAEPWYVYVLDALHEAAFRTEIGLLAGLVTARDERGRFEGAKQQKIATFKTAYYSFYLPVALAMYMCGIPHAPSPSSPSAESPQDPYALAQSILIPLGEYSQAQTDFFLASYGRDVEEEEDEETAVHEELGMKERYEAYEAEAYEAEAYARIKGMIDKGISEEGVDVSVQKGEGEVRLRREVFRVILDRIHKRRK